MCSLFGLRASYSAGPVWADGFWDQLFDRTAESAKRQAENRVNQRINQGIDRAMNKTEETIQCVATDRECLRRAKDEGKNVVLVGSPAQPDTVKCMATDTDCLKRAKQAKKKVEIVDEEELDTIRCAMRFTRERLSETFQHAFACPYDPVCRHLPVEDANLIGDSPSLR